MAILLNSKKYFKYYLFMIILLNYMLFSVRDYAPLFIRSDGKHNTSYHAIYEGAFDPLDSPSTLTISQSLLRLNDHQFSTKLASKLEATHRISIPYAFEWGNVLSNGNGLCISSDSLVKRNLNRYLHKKMNRNGKSDQQNRQPNLNNFQSDQKNVGPFKNEMLALEQEIVLYFDNHFGCRLLIVESLVDEPTGHVDMYMFLLSSDHLVYGMYGDEDVPNKVLSMNSD